MFSVTCWLAEAKALCRRVPGRDHAQSASTQRGDYTSLAREVC